MLQSQDLKISQKREPCIQDCLPYILKAHGPCFTTLAYPK